MAESRAVFVDAVQSIGVHNGVVRILMNRLNSDGKAVAELELLLPLAVAKSAKEPASLSGL